MSIAGQMSTDLKRRHTALSELLHSPKEIQSQKFLQDCVLSMGEFREESQRKGLISGNRGVIQFAQEDL